MQRIETTRPASSATQTTEVQATSPTTSIFSIFHNDVKVEVPKDALVLSDAIAIADDILTAGPLDVIEAKVKDNPKVLLARISVDMKIAGNQYTFEGNLEQIAIMNLDNTIKSVNSETAKKDEGDKGIAETLRALRIRLFPDTLPQALVRAQQAAPIEDEKEAKIREAAQEKVLNNVFEKIRVYDQKRAREIMEYYLASTIPPVITDNRHFLNLLKMIPKAFDVLIKRSEELKGTCYSEQAPLLYYFASIGVIQKVLPFKLRRILTTGVYYLLYTGSKINRNADVSEAQFVRENPFRLGFESFYDTLGGAPRGLGTCNMFSGLGNSAVQMKLIFSQLISAITAAQQDLCNTETLNHSNMRPSR